MGFAKENNTKEYSTLLQKIGQCFSQLNAEYISSQNQNDLLKKAWFAYGIVKVMLENSELIAYASLRSKQDLADSLETHNSKYLEIFQNAEDLIEVSLIFQTNVTNLINSCNNKKQANKNLNAQEIDVIRDLATDLLCKSQSLFSEQAYNQDTIDKLQASAIVFNMLQLPIKQQILLLDKLLLIKELWQAENHKSAEANSIEIIQKLEAQDSEEAFEKLVNIFIEEKNAIQSLSNEKMVELYDRLKNYEPQASVFDNILTKLHREAQYRYGYNRLSDSGYELLKRFQSFDAINQQIEGAEFSIAESFLLKKSVFLQETINTLSKHVDNIKAVGAAKNAEVKNVVNKLNKQITNLHLEEHPSSSTLSTIIEKLNAGIDSHIYKRYAELDKFAVSSLKNRYESFFKNLNQLLENAKSAKNFLQQSIIRKFAQDYYVSNLSNSVTKLKSMAGERTEIAKQLMQIDFVELFDPAHINNITSLSFKKNIKDSHPSNSEEYIQSLIGVLIPLCSPSQLENLYKPLEGNLTSVQNILKQAIIKQIKQRTTITKMFYSIFTGKKKEFDKLKTIKKFMNNNKFEEFEKIRNTPLQVKNEIENLSKKNAENEGMINRIKTVDTETETLDS